MTLGLILALGVGVALGMFGGGASMLAVVVLSFALGVPPKAAIAASLLTTGLASTAALIAQRRSRLVSTRAGVAFGGAGMVGAFVGSRLGHFLPEPVLLTGFGAVMAVTSIAMLRARESSSPMGEERANDDRSLHAPRVVMLALGIGMISGLLGAGGGLLIVPALVLRARMPLKRAMATSLLVIALQSFAGFVGHLGQPGLDWSVVAPFAFTATVGGVVGSVLSKRARLAPLRRGFAGLVLLVAIVVLARELSQVVERSAAHHRFELRA